MILKLQISEFISEVMDAVFSRKGRKLERKKDAEKIQLTEKEIHRICEVLFGISAAKKVFIELHTAGEMLRVNGAFDFLKYGFISEDDSKWRYNQDPTAEQISSIFNSAIGDAVKITIH